MKKTSVITFLLALCLGISAMFGLTACGKSTKTYVWERTWSYQNVVGDDLDGCGGSVDSNGNPVMGSSRNDLLKREFDNFDLKNVQINGKTMDLSAVKSVEVLKASIRTEIESFFQNELKGLIVTFSTKEEESVTVDAVTYSAQKNLSGENYDIVLFETTYGSFSEECWNINGNECINFWFNSNTFSVSVEIPTNTIVDDPTMESDKDEKGNVLSTKLCLRYTAFLSAENF